MLLPLLTVLLAPPPQPAVLVPFPDQVADSLVFHGSRGEVRVPAIRMEPVGIRVDGVLDEPAWARAARLTGFSQYTPQDGRSAADSTEVWIWHSATDLHLGVRAFAASGSVRATLAERDRIDSEDQIQFLLDTFDDARRALVFAVNPLGVQMDGVRTEADGGGRRGGFSAESEAHPFDRSPDFLFESAGRLTDFGYEVELRIPVRSLRYQSVPRQDWGLNVIRIVQSRGHSQTWTAAERGAPSFLAQSGRLEGIEGLDRGIVLDLNPEVTARSDGSPAGADRWGYGDPRPDVGGSVRWGITENLTLNGTVNPDFSQVEADAGRLTFDPRQAISFPEKRPFFLDGSERFEVPNQLVYTRSIVQPEVAAKVSGKVAAVDGGVLLAVDDAGASADGRSNPFFAIARLTRDVGSTSSIGMVYTDRSERGAYSRLGGIDGRAVRGSWTLTAQGALSRARTGEQVLSGHLWDVGISRAGRDFGLTGRFRGTDSAFRAGAGFVSRAGTVQASITPRISRTGAPGAWMERWSGAMMLSGNWLYPSFWKGDSPEDLKLHLNQSFSLRGGWEAGSSLLLERFWYPPYLYTDYIVERLTNVGVDTIPFTGTPSIGNVDVVLSVSTPTWRRFSGSLFVVGGRDENFDEWSPAWILIGTAEVDWRPTDQLRVSPTWSRQQYNRFSDGSRVRVRNLPRLKVEYQVNRAIFVRAVAQYDALWRDALRDDTRTGGRILIFDRATGRHLPAGEIRINRVQADLLFSVQPSPGTVFFAGYGSSLGEEEAFRFRTLERTRDGFFVKFSYLLRKGG